MIELLLDLLLYGAWLRNFSSRNTSFPLFTVDRSIQEDLEIQFALRLILR
jgi:hypothetical protein